VASEEFIHQVQWPHWRQVLFCCRTRSLVTLSHCPTSRQSLWKVVRRPCMVQLPQVSRQQSSCRGTDQLFWPTLSRWRRLEHRRFSELVSSQHKHHTAATGFWCCQSLPAAYDSKTRLSASLWRWGWVPSSAVNTRTAVAVWLIPLAHMAWSASKLPAESWDTMP